MLKRSTDHLSAPGHAESLEALRTAFDSAIKALDDPEIEQRVRAYFEKNPSFSRDAIHVAAVACQLAEQKTLKLPRPRGVVI